MFKATRELLHKILLSLIQLGESLNELNTTTKESKELLKKINTDTETIKQQIHFQRRSQ